MIGPKRIVLEEANLAAAGRDDIVRVVSKGRILVDKKPISAEYVHGEVAEQMAFALREMQDIVSDSTMLSADWEEHSDRLDEALAAWEESKK